MATLELVVPTFVAVLFETRDSLKLVDHNMVMSACEGGRGGVMRCYHMLSSNDEQPDGVQGPPLTRRVSSGFCTI